ncbi:Transposable element Tc1 transposase [Anthophora quadrimaculata]
MLCFDFYLLVLKFYPYLQWLKVKLRHLQILFYEGIINVEHELNERLTIEAKRYLGKVANPETIRIILRKNNFNGRIARRKPFVSQKNRSKRLQFVKLYKDKDFSFWETVLFTDESKFNIFRSDGQTYVWRKPNDEFREENMRPTVKYGSGSIMVWGSMSAAGPGNLHIINEIMDHKKYLQILKENLKDSVQKLGIAECFSFYQDNDPKHRAHNVRLWLLHQYPHVIETPPQSPDLNVIEHLWAYLEEKLKNHIISNAKDLEKALQEEWAKIDLSYCEKLVRSIPNRLKAIKTNKGLPTKCRRGHRQDETETSSSAYDTTSRYTSSSTFNATHSKLENAFVSNDILNLVSIVRRLELKQLISEEIWRSTRRDHQRDR